MSNNTNDYTKEYLFWKRLKSFVSDVQTGCAAGEEEKEMILFVCDKKMHEYKNQRIYNENSKLIV